jgi:molecular chaperone GrpE
MTKEKKPALFQMSQKAIIYDPETKKFLLAKFSPEVSKNTDRWAFIGGRIDEGEGDSLDALKREIVEEAGGIEYEIKGVIDTQVDGRCRIGYLVFYKGGEITLSEEHSEYAWLTPEEIEHDENHQEYVKRFIRSAVAKMKSEEYLDDLKRLQADFENYKKRQAESQKELAGYLIEKLLFDIIPVLDNFRMATGHVPEDAKDSPWVTGIQYIEKQLEDVLKGHGVEVMEIKEGDAFDPTKMEAVSSDEEAGEGKQVVGKVLQNGYRIGERVVRAAKVTVASS